MLNAERKQRIIENLERVGVIKLAELVEALDCSESTIRRDLIELEQEGLLERVHGGARLLNAHNIEPSMNEKSFKNIQSKQEIARYSAELVAEGDCIYLDAGSTTIEMIPFLADRRITVVTNGLAHIEKLVQLRIDAYLLGGKMKVHTKAVVGAVALNNLTNYHFDKAFLGTNAIHLEYGHTTPDTEEALLKRSAGKQAANTFVLADHSKFGHIHFARIFDLEDATIVTDYIPQEMKDSFIQKTKIIEVGK
ncbi:DeoR/GlpR family DNA-binding transcription regulator [Listeria costaricensis]|uniref:DeoR/GlpR family DNA-binding transcription regulator n=1 Tax=Listeria costaricensis TaxID=2026604 RepID=UPI000C071BE6|nr:DeoR/GlpR family DNA-binding transcription regulator [Listeria costaricensis]